MTCEVSIIIPAFKRPNLLKWGLFSLFRQDIPYNFETIVLNDGINDETESICKEYSSSLNLRYVFTGQRNLQGEIKWRVPGFTINIGARLAEGKFLVICDAEMFHLNNTIKYLIRPLENNPYYLSIPILRDDKTGYFLQFMKNINGNVFTNTCDRNFPRLNARLPFLMSLRRDIFFAVGGYDENFTGRGWDDNDLIARLKRNGCRHYETPAQAIHLYHPRHTGDKFYHPEYLHNRKKFEKNNKDNLIVCNQNRLWGSLFDLN